MFPRRIVLALGVLSISCVGAMAADMPMKAPPIAPPPPPPFSWTGFYIGVHAGGSWSADNDPDYTLTDPTGGAPFTSRNFAWCGAPAGVASAAVTSPNPFDIQKTCNNDSSFLGGGQIGYNWQSGALVLGVEADASWRKLVDYRFGIFGANATAGQPMGSVATDTAYFKTKQDWIGTLRGRVGYAPGNWLLYVTGGLAYGHVEHSFTEVLAPGTTCVVTGGFTCRTISDSDTKFGWTIGAGFEFAFWQHWSIGAEYLYVDLGDTTLTLTPIAGGGFFTNTGTATFHDRSHIARAKLNYRF
jgi:outer membrane immunogenic protein